MRDDITRLPGTRLGRKYARMKGGGGERQSKLFGELQADTVGKKFNSPFHSDTVGEYTDGKKLPEASEQIKRILGRSD